jgi:hypothetical protein
MTTKAIYDSLGEALTTEEHFVIHSAQSVEEARQWLDGFRKERAETMALIETLRLVTKDREVIGKKLAKLLLDAADKIERKETHLALLRGQVAGLTHRAEAAEKTIGLRS